MSSILPSQLKKPKQFLFSTAIAVCLCACESGKEPAKSYEYAVQGLYSASISPDSQHIIVGSINHGASLWRFNTNERLFSWNHKQGEYSQITASNFSNNSLFSVTTTPQTLAVWNTQTGEGASYWAAPSEILDIELLDNNTHALLGLGDHTAALFNIKQGGIDQVYYHDQRVNSVDYNIEKNIVLSGSDDLTARLWNKDTAEEIYRWPHRNEVDLVALSQDGSIALTVSKYDKAALWNTQSGASIGEIPINKSAISRGIMFTSAIFSNDNTQLLTGTSNRVIQLWDIRTLKVLKKWRIPRRNPASPTSATILALSFSDDGYIAVSSDGYAHLLK